MWRRLIYHPEINYALRQTLVLCLPVLFGLLIGQLQLGLMFSLVPACCNIAGLDTPHKRFFKRLIVGGSLFAFSSVLLQQALLWHVPLPALMLGTALLLGVTGEISPLHARLLPAALVAAIFALSTAGTVPIWQAPLLYAIGTARYGLFTVLVQTVERATDARDAEPALSGTGGLFRSQILTADPAHRSADRAAAAAGAPAKVMDLISLLYQQQFPAARQQPRAKAPAARLSGGDGPAGAHHRQPASAGRGAKLVEQSRAEAIIRRNAQVIAGRLRAVAHDILYHQHSKRFSMTHELAALEKWRRSIPITRLASFVITTSAASPACCAPSIRCTAAT